MNRTTAAHHLGLDVGSTALKLVVTRAADDQVVWSAYRRHESRIAERAAELLARAERETDLRPATTRAFATGTGASTLAETVGASVVPEVPAFTAAAERRFPSARSIVEIGGHDAKIIVLDRRDGGTRRHVSMNDKCAGGTGAVIDKIVAKLGLPLDALAGLRYEGRTIHPVAGKCGVFAETDINGLQKRGVPAEELLASLFDAIVVQNLAVLARGRVLRPPVLLLGGPHAFILGLREAWRAHLVRVWRERGELDGASDGDGLVQAPPGAEFFTALGAIQLGSADGSETVEYQGARSLTAALATTVSTARRRGVPGLSCSGLDLSAFRAGFTPPAWTPPVFRPGEVVSGFIGLDAGSTSTKAVLLSESGEVLAKAYELSRGNPIEDAIDMFRALRSSVETSGARVDVRGLVTTGYAKDMLRDVFCADAALVETVAHARSALQLYDDPHVIVDVGGQDIKIVVLRDGRVKDFRLNTQCSAGNGYFLQAIARTLGYPVEAFADAAFSAAEMPEFGYGCVLFLQSEIENVLRMGWRPEEVLAGLASVLPKNVFLYVAKAPNLARLGTRFVLQGGTQRNLAAVKAQVDFIRESFHGQLREPEIVLHRHCGEAGAIGAALEAVRLWQQGRRTTFIGLDAAERVVFVARADESTRCDFCKNACLRTFLDVWVGARDDAPAGADAHPRTADAHTRRAEASRLRAERSGVATTELEERSRAASADTAPPRPGHRRVVIASCEKGAAEDLEAMRRIKAGIDSTKTTTPNLVALAAREVFRPRHPASVAEPPVRPWTPAARARAALVERRSTVRVGIPRVFNMYAFAPLFSAYLESLGVPSARIVYSDFTSQELYRAGANRGAIDPCFPSKVALAHVHQLLFDVHAKHPLTCIFFPMMDVLPDRLEGTVGSDACPTVALTPQTVRAAFTREKDLFAERGVAFLSPLLDLRDRKLFAQQMFHAWAPILGVTRRENAHALDAGFDALAQYEREVQRAAREALDALERDDRVGIVLLGRVYHHDPGLNHGIPEDLQKLGYTVFSQSTLPMDEELLDRLFGEEIRRGDIRHARDISDVWRNSFSASSNAKVWAAKFVARHPKLVAVELSNFKCGHDAPLYATIEEIVEASGTPFFAFRDIDENKPSGAIKLRLETIDYALRRHAEKLRAVRATVAPLERAMDACASPAAQPA